MLLKNIKISEYNIVFDEIIKKNNSLRVFLFRGEIGSGKTTLIKYLLKRLCVNGSVSSPTFNIINEYINDNNEYFYHFDLYRIKSKNELIEIGFDEYISSGQYCFIEWPEISHALIDDNFVNINLSIRDHSSRDIKITFH